MAKSIKSKYPHLLAYWQQNNFILVPIPLHTHRFNWRGFNQSELICRELSLKLKLSFDSNILVRSINTIPQTTLKNKSLRRSNIESVFTLKKSFAPLTQGGIKRGFENDKWLNDKYILVDDVYTTGSTINSAKSVFSKNTELWTLTIAG
jgi:predicted amidophosphoribosyltransferase